jgi:hypothetical protein
MSKISPHNIASYCVRFSGNLGVVVVGGWRFKYARMCVCISARTALHLGLDDLSRQPFRIKIRVIHHRNVSRKQQAKPKHLK